MNGLALADRVWVKFHGDRGGDGPMTLGQHNTIQWLGRRPSEHFLAKLEWLFGVPATITVDDVAAVWSVLLSRHESLRTTYPLASDPSGWPLQRVAVSGEIAIEVYEVQEGDAATVARALIGALRERPFELDRDFPVRVGVAVTRNSGRSIRAVAAVYSHMAVDFGAMTVLGREFAELAAEPASRVVGPRRHQPLDQAAAERSARGRKRAEAALRYWRQHIRRGPQCMFALPDSVLSEPVPEDEGLPPTCALYSPAGASALPDIVRRTGASPAVVTLAAACAVLTHRTVNRYCMLATLSSNRAEVRLRRYVGTLVQYGLMFIDAGTTRFDDLVRRVGTASLRAHRHSMFDADQLEAVHQAVNRGRGTSYDQDFVFNNLSAHAVNPRGWGLVSHGGEVAGDMGADMAGSPQGAEGTLGWWTPRWIPPALVQIDLLETKPLLELGLVSGDIGRVPRAELGLLLRGTERLLAAAAAGDVDLGELTEITGVAPVAREENWLHIDSCWIDLSATRRMVAEALPGAAPAVFAVSVDVAGGRGGTTVLTAYLAATEDVRSPEQAHAACMRALPGRHTVMAPGRYVLCASVPADPLDLTGWQRQTVLSDGDGRRGD